MAVSANIIAYASSAAAPQVSQADKVLAETALPVATVQLYGDAVDGDDGAPTWTWKWYLLDKPAGSAAAITADTVQNAVLQDVDVWGNYLLFLVATNTHNANKTSQTAYIKAPSCSLVVVRVQEQVTGLTLEKLARGERKWQLPFRALVAAAKVAHQKATLAYAAMLTLASTAPASVGTANAVGVGTTPARADHVHAHGTQLGGTLHAAVSDAAPGFAVLATTAPEAVGTAAIGTGVTTARADHVHAHGAQDLGDGTGHAGASTSVAGFMSAADKIAVDGIRSLLVFGCTAWDVAAAGGQQYLTPWSAPLAVGDLIIARALYVPFTGTLLRIVVTNGSVVTSGSFTVTVHKNAGAALATVTYDNASTLTQDTVVALAVTQGDYLWVKVTPSTQVDGNGPIQVTLFLKAA